MYACPRVDCGGRVVAGIDGTATCILCARGEIVARPPTAEELGARANVRDEIKLHRQKMNQRRCVAARKARLAA